LIGASRPFFSAALGSTIKDSFFHFFWPARASVIWKVAGLWTRWFHFSQSLSWSLAVCPASVPWFGKRPSLFDRTCLATPGFIWAGCIPQGIAAPHTHSPPVFCGSFTSPLAHRSRFMRNPPVRGAPCFVVLFFFDFQHFPCSFSFPTDTPFPRTLFPASPCRYVKLISRGGTSVLTAILDGPRPVTCSSFHCAFATNFWNRLFPGSEKFPGRLIAHLSLAAFTRDANSVRFRCVRYPDKATRRKPPPTPFFF